MDIKYRIEKRFVFDVVEYHDDERYFVMSTERTKDEAIAVRKRVEKGGMV